MGYIGREQWDPRGIRLDPLHIDLREWASRCTETKRRIVVGCYDREAKTGWTIPVLPGRGHAIVNCMKHSLDPISVFVVTDTGTVPVAL